MTTATEKSTRRAVKQRGKGERDPYEIRLSKSDRPRTLEPKTISKVLTVIVLTVVLLYFLFPIIWSVIAATKTNADIRATHGLWFADHSAIGENYDKLIGWTKGRFWRWVGNSIFYSTTAGVVGTLISVAAGYAIAKFRFPGRRTMLVVIMAGLLLPIALLTIPMYIVFHSLGMTNTVWAVIIPSCVSPFGVFLGTIYSDTSVPNELLEAARIDGASEARIFFTMVLRLLAPAMVTIFLFIFVATWNNFLLPLMMLSDDSLKPITLGLYGMMSYFAPVYGAVLQGALLGVIPLVFLFLGLQRFWQAGLAAGAVKG